MLALLPSPLCSVACSQCLPCVTPPCYKNSEIDDVYLTSNSPGNAFGGSSASCWMQRASHASASPSGERCSCAEDYTEFEQFSTGLDSLGREVTATRDWYHIFCAPVRLDDFTINDREPVGGQPEIYGCGCQSNREVRTPLKPGLSLLANGTARSNSTRNGAPPTARPGGRLELISERFHVQLADGSRVDVSGPASPANASSSSESRHDGPKARRAASDRGGTLLPSGE